MSQVSLDVAQFLMGDWDPTTVQQSQAQVDPDLWVVVSDIPMSPTEPVGQIDPIPSSTDNSASQKVLSPEELQKFEEWKSSQTTKSQAEDTPKVTANDLYWPWSEDLEAKIDESFKATV